VHVGGDELGSVYAVTLEVICVKSSWSSLFLFCLSLACAIDWILEKNLEIYVLQG
jgi:hypothetical protein